MFTKFMNVEKRVTIHFKLNTQEKINKYIIMFESHVFVYVGVYVCMCVCMG